MTDKKEEEVVDLGNFFVDNEKKKEKETTEVSFSKFDVFKKVFKKYLYKVRHNNFYSLFVFLILLILSVFLIVCLTSKTQKNIEYKPNTKYQGQVLPDDYR